MASVYDLKPAFSRLLRPLVAYLASHGVTGQGLRPLTEAMWVAVDEERARTPTQTLAPIDFGDDSEFAAGYTGPFDDEFSDLDLDTGDDDDLFESKDTQSDDDRSPNP